MRAPGSGNSGGRSSCALKAGRCGSCRAEINGLPKLMCMARLSALLPGPVTVTLIPTFPVIRDLVTDVFDYRTAQRI
jgi:succinate dehydrogenase / fumarate reductase iron-sulfur subunit